MSAFGSDLVMHPEINRTTMAKRIMKIFILQRLAFMDPLLIIIIDLKISDLEVVLKKTKIR